MDIVSEELARYYMHSDYIELAWKNACIDAYVPVDDSEDWTVCPVCSQRPRAWLFDNGRYARCLCSKDKYATGDGCVSAESVMEVFRRDGNTAKYDFDGLRKAWNARCAAIDKEDRTWTS